MADKKLDILDQFEIGGNFFELIEFSLVRRMPKNQVYVGVYGVNVAKVREVVHMPKINPLASSVEGVAGIFELRGIPIPAVNLNKILGDYEAPITQDQQIIVTEFSQKRAGFIVSHTHRIRRVSWDKVLPPSTDSSSCMTGMILLENNEFLFILDLEKILAGLESVNQPQPNIYAQSEFNQPSADSNKPIDRNSLGILVVDDSKLILSNLKRVLSGKGFRVITANNGQEGLGIVEAILSGDKKYGPIHAIITDIEMPKMDGLTFIRKMRENPDLQSLPILLHTSLDGKATQAAAKKVGANGYVIKNDIDKIISYLDRFFESSPIAIGS